MEFSMYMKLQIRDDICTIHTAQLVYSNHQDLGFDYLQCMMSYWLDQKFVKQMGNIKKFKIVAVPILCNLNVQLN